MEASNDVHKHETTGILSKCSSLSLVQSANSNHRTKGLPLWLASVFIVGEMAGSGVLALPKAIADAGWSGIALLIISCLNTLYAAICLGRSWMIIEERYDEYREKNRYPYAAIAYRAVGTKMRPAAIGALVTTTLACILLIVALVKEERKGTSHPEYPPPTVMSFFLAFGTILFAFGGASTFPTFQNDMRDRSQFPKAVTIGFSVLLLLYLPVAVLGYSVYGKDLNPDIIQTLPDSSLRSAVEILLALHLFFAFLLVINTPAQEMEEFLKVPKRFGWKRCMLRTAVMLLIIFVAQSIPRFGKVLNLIGGSTATLTTSVFPCYFYLMLCSQESTEWPQKRIPLYEKIYLFFIMITGIIGGCISTYSAITDIAQAKSFNPPCYVNITAAGNQL
ncbi:amino acid transporter AVT1D-like isoform X2 [Stegodyphus dumicola]|uniref:amino acid transporter AVT1D-like isoform X2 n=1 Tax=Stegodyphus dumicola TaxID=202533 RepID=UPI0015ADE6CF|nr:amino acid transporter AVT1D-like isoform X2 [Stegodyphus dumicola]